MSIVNGLLSDLLDFGPLYARPTNWWNLDISDWAKDPQSDTLIASAIAVVNQQTGATLNEFGGRMHPDFNYVNPLKPYGINYCVVDLSTPRVYVHLDDTSGESDPGPYPIPEEAKTNLNYIENQSRQNPRDGDMHLIMIDRQTRIVYELSYARWDGTRWSAGYGAIFDLKTNTRRREGATSSDAAGLCVLAGLIRYDEVYGPDPILHSLRFCLKQNNGYVFPASHDNQVNYAGAPPLGSRLRLKASFDVVNKVGGGTYSPAMQKILTCLKTYGGIMADRGGGFFLQGTMDPRWPWLGPEFHTLHLPDFEFVKMGYNPPIGGNKKIEPSLE